MTDNVTERIAVLESKHESHEQTCGDRYKDISESFGRVHGRLDWIMRSTMGVLITLVGALLYELWKVGAAS